MSLLKQIAAYKGGDGLDLLSDSEISQSLEESKAYVNEGDSEGRTPLMHAVEKGIPKLVLGLWSRPRWSMLRLLAQTETEQ